MKTFSKFIILFSVFYFHNFSYGQSSKSTIPYGDNESVGKYADINGIKMYYEEYGSGEPIFLIHGNSGSIKDMSNQIDYFKSKYRVIIADNRGQGKSSLNTDSLTYVQISDDWVELANHLEIDSINIIGWSDGGIAGLLMGIHHPEKVKKLVTMGVNLRPDTSAVSSWAVNWGRHEMEVIEEKISKNDTSLNLPLQKQLLGLLLNQPNISHADLTKIQAPVLVMAGDKDIIKGEHSLEIFKNLPNAHLCIMPGETHFTPVSNPELFNRMAGDFIAKPFKRPDSDWTKKRE